MTQTRHTALKTTSRFAAALLAAAGLLAGLAGLTQPAPAAAAGDCGGTASAEDIDQAGQLLARINTYRQQNGRAALTADGTLAKAAGWMSRDMVGRKDGVGHVDSLDRNIGPRLVDCGYTGFASVYYRENVCCTVSGNGSVKTPEQAFEAWRTSYEHNKNMLDATMTFAGVGRSCDAQTCYWALDLGTQGTNAPLPGSQPPAGASNAAPSTPLGLRWLTAPTRDTLHPTLTWTDTANEDSYKVTVRCGSFTFSGIYPYAAKDATTWQHSYGITRTGGVDAVCSNQVTYELQACNSAGCSAPASVTRPAFK
jgi:uncharacterized protein YkwD